MARSLIGGMIARGAAPDSIAVAEPQSALRESLQREFGVQVFEHNHEAARRADLLLLAVKPQAMRSVCEGLAGQVGAATVVSIAAGVTCAQLDNWLGGAPSLVRCMPNTPSLIGAGATGLYASASTSQVQRDAAAEVLGTVGVCVWIEDEAQMDAVTAVSGSGPAYVFLLAEAMQQAGIEVGLEPEVARTLAQQTLLGAARMLAESEEDAATLRRRVTSPGGTTQAAIESFQADGFERLVERAIRAAYRRGAELSRQLQG
jgi:pyrroline-5-carboxylate reductase